MFLKAALHCEHLTAIKGFLEVSRKADTLRLLGSAQEVSGQPGSRRDHLFRMLAMGAEPALLPSLRGSTSAGRAAVVCQGSYVHFYELTGFDLLNSLLLLPVLGFYLSRGLEILCLGTITGTGSSLADQGQRQI